MFCCTRSPRFLIIILLIIAGIIGFGFYFQWSFVMQYWPYFLILLCPLIHIFGRHGHKDKDSDIKHEDEDEDEDKTSCH